MEFYAKYDVMTGIRIAATLGGFFIFMVFLVVYKSRSKSSKALKEMQVKNILIKIVTEINFNIKNLTERSKNGGCCSSCYARRRRS